MLVSSPCKSNALRKPRRSRQSIGFKKPRKSGATISANSVSCQEMTNSTSTKATSETTCLSTSATAWLTMSLV